MLVWRPLPLLRPDAKFVLILNVLPILELLINLNYGIEISESIRDISSVSVLLILSETSSTLLFVVEDLRIDALRLLSRERSPSIPKMMGFSLRGLSRWLKSAVDVKFYRFCFDEPGLSVVYCLKEMLTNSCVDMLRLMDPRNAVCLRYCCLWEFRTTIFGFKDSCNCGFD